MPSVELTDGEKLLLKEIDFSPESFDKHDAEYWKRVGIFSERLMDSLLARQAISKVRLKYFADPEFNVGGRGSSRLQIFERNGTRGKAVYRHPLFLKYLKYFLYGPELPAGFMSNFEAEVKRCGWITSGDIGPLAKLAKALTRSHGLEGREIAEEVYKLALDCGLDSSDARSIRDAVKR